MHISSLKNFFPKNFILCLSTIKNLYLVRFAVKSYSQEGEDIILNRIFNKNKGFFVDVGAHHPFRFSNTYFFYKKGWRGINIDAAPGSMKLFNKFRKRDINLELAINSKRQKMDFFIFEEGALNSFSQELSEKRMAAGFPLKYKTEIVTSTLEEVLNAHNSEFETIDFLSIDVEGSDLDVLRSNDFKKYRPKVIIVEVLNKGFKEVLESGINRFLEEQHYVLRAKSINSVFYTDSLVKNFL